MSYHGHIVSNVNEICDSYGMVLLLNFWWMIRIDWE